MINRFEYIYVEGYNLIPKIPYIKTTKTTSIYSFLFQAYNPKSKNY